MSEARMYQVLLGAHISEKATVVADAATLGVIDVDPTNVEVWCRLLDLGLEQFDMFGIAKQRGSGLEHACIGDLTNPPGYRPPH